MASSPKIINDPVHKVMTFSERQDIIEMLLELSNHPFFQRLRRIKQLGCGDLIFPGAVHTRFNHCLGACYIAKRFCDKLKLEDDDRKITLVSALIHDVGHGPFSHAFEKVYGDKKIRISHDKNWNNKFFEKYKIFSSSELQKIRAIFDEESKAACKLKLTLTRDIISSQLDVDRLDYLLRDSHFCGVPYGNIDLDWIVSCIVSVDVKSGKKLGITRKGLGAVEHYLTARRLMTRNIYYHGKKNAAEYYMKVFLRSLMTDLVGNEKYIKNNFKELKDSDFGKFLFAMHEYIQDVDDIEDDFLTKKKNSFVNKYFDIYSNLTDDDVWLAIKRLYKISNKNDCSLIARNLIVRALPKYYALSPSRIQSSKSIISHFKMKNKSIREWQIYIDDLNFISYEQEKEPIYMVDHDNEDEKNYSDLVYESGFLNLISGKKEYNYFLYVDQNVHEKCFPLLQELNSSGCLVYPWHRK